MKSIDSEGKSYLLFPDQPVITHRWQTVGLILVPETNNPDSLNIFRVFISGNSKAKVEKFVDYQIKQGRKNAKAIQVQVEKLDASQIDIPSVPEPFLPSVDEIKKLFSKAEKEQPDFLYSFGEITVGIDRVYMSTKPPYRIKYTVDPVFRFLFQGEKYSFEFSADRPFISLQSLQGDVHLDLFENCPYAVQQVTSALDVKAGETQILSNVVKQFAGMWHADVIGRKLENSFTIDYAKDVLR
jgi:hypothetical protein